MCSSAQGNSFHAVLYYFEQFCYLCGAVSLGLSGALGGSKILVWLVALLLAENSWRVVGRPGPSSPPPTPSPFFSWDIPYGSWRRSKEEGFDFFKILILHSDCSRKSRDRYLNTVLRIREVYPRSRISFRIPDPTTTKRGGGFSSLTFYVVLCSHKLNNI